MLVASSAAYCHMPCHWHSSWRGIHLVLTHITICFFIAWMPCSLGFYIHTYRQYTMLYFRSSYTAVYFSELYLVEDRDDDCIYSSPSLLPSSDYLQLGISDVNKKLISSSGEDVELRIGSRTSISALHDSTTCGSDYPYCFSDEGECRKLNDYPWHNQGLEHIHLQEYMSWWVDLRVDNKV